MLPRWTSDGRDIVFFEYQWADRLGGGSVVGGPTGVGTSYLIPRFGGSVTSIVRGAIWGEQGGRVVYQRRDSIFEQSIDGGRPTLAIQVPPEAHSFAWSPDGSRLAYVDGNSEFMDLLFLGNIAPSSIWIIGKGGGDPVQVTDRLSLHMSPVWLPDGRHLLFVSDRDGARDIYVVRVDGAGRPRGEPVRITTGLDPQSLSLSADGSVLAYSRFSLRRNVRHIAIPETGTAMKRKNKRIGSSKKARLS